MALPIDGTFQTPNRYSVREFTAGIASGDWNRDDNLDLAATSDRLVADNSLPLLPGKGDGTFSFGAPYYAGISPQALAAGDWNADGKTDFAAVT